ncbi:polyamine deacetylase HDAC10 [Orycteropus afer afer]|uniref:Polyamine deacetylase HDAC10 n=1 Tax=Orycteropus afer afer TaxID=1230840 RepID=A0A8B7AYD2_ORYAF|nr:polyamine deacetylase HDAC10 [Orycteropus afer afer]
MGTALVYHEDMTVARLLWDDPECEIECPERVTVALERLQQHGLEQRCLRLAAREASEAELGLVHSPEYVAVVRGTQVLGTEELQALSAQYDAVYFHPSTFRCARLAVGAALKLVDAVLTGAAHNGLALVRPPGHHSQRAAANGFCVFNNVAIAAEHAKQNHGLHRILIVDWDIHHGQGTQYIFEDDPSVLYFSWHRYEHGHFWPFLRESDADVVGHGRGRGFTVNVPWNQVGMGNADYMAAFLHVLLPLAFEFDPELVLVSAGFDSAIGDPEGHMQATPECFAHLTQLLLALAGGRVCAVLEGGYHLESLAESACMTVQALLGDPAPPLSGIMVPCWSALESIQHVRAAQAPHWTSLQDQDTALEPNPSACSPEGRPPPPPPGTSAYEEAAIEAAAQAAVALSSLLDRLRLHPLPPVRTAIALTSMDATPALPLGVLHQEGSALREETKAWARPHEALAQDEALTALGKVLNLVDKILGGQVSSGIAAIPTLAVAATLDVVIRRGLYLGTQKLFCVALGQLDRPPDFTDDGRILWLNIGGQEAAALSMFCISVPLPRETGGLLSCILGLVLPLAYGFQPDLVLVVLGPSHSLQDTHAALLASMLRGPAGGRVLALVQESRPHLAGALARALHGEAPPSLGPCSRASAEDLEALKYLRGQLESEWRMLQVAGLNFLIYRNAAPTGSARSRGGATAKGASTVPPPLSIFSAPLVPGSRRSRGNDAHGRQSGNAGSTCSRGLRRRPCVGSPSSDSLPGLRGTGSIHSGDSGSGAGPRRTQGKPSPCAVSCPRTCRSSSLSRLCDRLKVRNCRRLLPRGASSAPRGLGAALGLAEAGGRPAGTSARTLRARS